MQIMDPQPMHMSPSVPAHERPRRDTISVQRAARDEDPLWHGAAPRPLDERDKRWRPPEAF